MDIINHGCYNMYNFYIEEVTIWNFMNLSDKVPKI